MEDISYIKKMLEWTDEVRALSHRTCAFCPAAVIPGSIRDVLPLDVNGGPLQNFGLHKYFV